MQLRTIFNLYELDPRLAGSAISKYLVQEKCQENWAVAKRSMLKISDWSRITLNLASVQSTGKGNRREAKKK